MPNPATHPDSALQSDGCELFWATPDVAIGSTPAKPGHLDLLRRQGLGAVLNLSAADSDPPDTGREDSLECRSLSVDDEGVPDMTALDESLNWLDAHLARGVKVCIHCRSGMGRAGAVLACWLARRGICLQPGPGWRAAPASSGQQGFVKEYLQRLGIAPPHHGLWERLMHCLFGH